METPTTPSEKCSEKKKPEKTKPSVGYTVWRIARLLLIPYCIVMLLVVIMENKIVYPLEKYPLPEGEWEFLERSKGEEVNFTSEDGTKLHGVYFAHPNPRGYLLFCHGNAGNLSTRTDEMASLSRNEQLSVFIFDYRGYGKSEGSPNEKGVMGDGRAAAKWLAEKGNVPLKDLILMGRSLGTGVVVDLAANQGAKALILQSPFTSLPDVGAAKISWLPVRWLMRNRYNSISKIKDYTGPVLMSHGTKDETIPFENGKLLFEAANEDKVFVEMKGKNHNDQPTRDYHVAVKAILIKALKD